MCNVFWKVLCVLPIAPFISMIFYWASLPDNKISKIFKKVGLNKDEFNKDDYKDSSQLELWIREKIFKHLGFIMEAAIEAFPGSILQMIAIVYFNETNILSAVSILISLLSVCTKSLGKSNLTIVCVCLFFFLCF